MILPICTDCRFYREKECTGVEDSTTDEPSCYASPIDYEAEMQEMYDEAAHWEEN